MLVGALCRSPPSRPHAAHDAAHMRYQDPQNPCTPAREGQRVARDASSVARNAAAEEVRRSDSAPGNKHAPARRAPHAAWGAFRPSNRARAARRSRGGAHGGLWCQKNQPYQHGPQRNKPALSRNFAPRSPRAPTHANVTAYRSERSPDASPGRARCSAKLRAALF